MQLHDGLLGSLQDSSLPEVTSRLSEARVNTEATAVLLVSLSPTATCVDILCCDDNNSDSEKQSLVMPKHAQLLLSMTEMSATLPGCDFEWPEALTICSSQNVIVGGIKDFQGNIIGAVLIVLRCHQLTSHQKHYASIARQQIELSLQYKLIQHPFTDKLAEKIQLLNEIGRISHVGGWELDIHAGLVSWTRETYLLFGVTPGRDITVERALANFPQVSREKITKAMKAAIKSLSTFALEVEYINAEGYRRWLKMTGTPQSEVTSSHQDKVYRIYGSVQDITEHKRLSDTQHNYTEYLSTILDSISDALVTIDEEGTVITANNTVEHVLGYDADELIGQDIFILVPKVESQNTKEYLKTFMKGGRKTAKSSPENHLVSHKNGGLIPVDISLSSFHFDMQKRIVLVFRDMSVRKQLADQVYQAAYYDNITQLPNAKLFEKGLKCVIRKAGVTYADIYCAQIVIDNISQYKQAFGQPTADYVMRILASRLTRTFCKPFVVFKGAENSFYLLYEDIITEEDIDARHAIDAVRQQFTDEVCSDITLHNSLHKIYAVVTICQLKGMETSVTKVRHMLGEGYNQLSEDQVNAPVVFHSASSVGYDRYNFIRQSLGAAVSNHELFIELQPQYESDGSMVCAEALVRWQHPQLGLITPAEFIPIAEESDAIVEIGQWVMNECGKLLYECNKSGLRTRLSINISAKHMARADFSEKMLAVIAHWNIPNGSLTIELREAALIGSFALVRTSMKELADKGVSFSIDHFGSGNLNLSYLRDLCIKEVKLDRHFIDEEGENGAQSPLLNSIFDIAKIFELRTVAEGIENNTQFNDAIKRGCHVFQGYFLDKPLNVRDWRAKLPVK